MLLTLSDDIRVILIKIADRLHNMRTLDSMKREKQLKIAGETDFMYAPLGPPLGLYTIKSELEDLSLRYRQPEEYAEIEQKLRKTKAVAPGSSTLCAPIKEALAKEGLNFTIKGRPKSIASIWNKMQKQKVSFEDIYDIFAIRIVLDTKREQEKERCVADLQCGDGLLPAEPRPAARLDFHTQGEWLREPAHHGDVAHRQVGGGADPFGAHGRDCGEGLRGPLALQGSAADSRLDQWIGQIREVIEGGEDSALEFVDELKLDLFNEEVYVFTPNGDLIVLAKGATHWTLPFACTPRWARSALVPRSTRSSCPSVTSCRAATRLRS